jgi:hypothetical protein
METQGHNQARASQHNRNKKKKRGNEPTTREREPRAIGKKEKADREKRDSNWKREK